MRYNVRLVSLATKDKQHKIVATSKVSTARAIELAVQKLEFGERWYIEKDGVIVYKSVGLVRQAA